MICNFTASFNKNRRWISWRKAFAALSHTTASTIFCQVLVASSVWLLPSNIWITVKKHGYCCGFTTFHPALLKERATANTTLLIQASLASSSLTRKPCSWKISLPCTCFVHTVMIQTTSVYSSTRTNMKWISISLTRNWPFR